MDDIKSLVEQYQELEKKLREVVKSTRLDYLTRRELMKILG